MQEPESNTKVESPRTSPVLTDEDDPVSLQVAIAVKDTESTSVDKVHETSTKEENDEEDVVPKKGQLRFKLQHERTPSKRLWKRNKSNGSGLVSKSGNNLLTSRDDLLALSFNRIMKSSNSLRTLEESERQLDLCEEKEEEEEEEYSDNDDYNEVDVEDIDLPEPILEEAEEEEADSDEEEKVSDMEKGELYHEEDPLDAILPDEPPPPLPSPANSSVDDAFSEFDLEDTPTGTGVDWRIVATDAFHSIDQNKDGYLQRNEVFLAIAKMKRQNVSFDDDHVSDPARFVDGLMKEVDTDGDGQIDYGEFMAMMRKGLFFYRGATQRGHAMIPNRLYRITQFARNVFLSHQQKIESNTIGEDLWLIHPLGKFHSAWDIMISLLILIVFITLPLSLGWDELNNKFLVMITVFDFFFLLDMCKNFVTGYIDENDAIVLDANAVASHYLRGYFVTDLLGSFPYDLVLHFAGIASDRGLLLGAKHSLKTLKLFRFFKFFRFARVSNLVQTANKTFEWFEEKLNIHLSHGLSKLFGLFVLALVLAHWMGCINFMLVRLYDFPSDSWVVVANLQNESVYSQWNWSFFKGLAFFILIGFQASPFTNSSCETTSDWCKIEHWTTLVCLLLGGLFQTVIVAWMISIHQTTNLASRSFEEKLNQLDGFLKSQKLPATMRAKVLDHFHQEYPNQRYYDPDVVQKKLLSPLHLRELKLLLAKRDIFRKVPLLSCPQNQPFGKELATRLKPMIVFAGDEIFQEQTSGDKMYFIASGLVELTKTSQKKKEPYLVVGDGCYFGEVSLLMGIKRTLSARAKTQCYLYQATKQDLLSLLHDFPEVATRMTRVAMNRQQRLQHALNENNSTRQQEESSSEDSKDNKELRVEHEANKSPKTTVLEDDDDDDSEASTSSRGSNDSDDTTTNHNIV